MKFPLKVNKQIYFISSIEGKCLKKDTNLKLANEETYR